MLLFILLPLILGQTILFSEDFSSAQLSKSWTNKTNVAIVSCPNSTSDYCMYFATQTYGGQLFSTNINIPDLGQDIYVEFQYLTKSVQVKGTYSGLIAGYTNPQRTGYCWAATGYAYESYSYQKYISNSSDSTYQNYLCQNIASVQIQDILNGWKTIKYSIPSSVLQSNNLTELNLVFQDFEDSGNSPGAYYITQILVYYSTNCTSMCKTCTTFYDCTSCSDGYRYLEGKCYKVDCGLALEQAVPYNLDNLTQTATPTTYTATITMPNYVFEECWPAQWVTLGLSDSKFTDLEWYYDTTTSVKMTLSQTNISYVNCDQNTTNANKFTCMFHFNIHFNEQIMYQKNWTASIDFSNQSVQSEYKAVQLSDLPALLIQIEASIEYCQKFSSCIWTTDPITLYLNQIFGVKLTIHDSNLQNWILSKGYVKLSGNGTLSSLTIVNSTVESLSIIYAVKLVYKGEKGNGLVVTAQITNPNSGRRRVLADETTTDKLAVASIDGTSITYKTRELIIESNPELSFIISIQLLLFLIFGM